MQFVTDFSIRVKNLNLNLQIHGAQRGAGKSIS